MIESLVNGIFLPNISNLRLCFTNSVLWFFSRCRLLDVSDAWNPAIFDVNTIDFVAFVRTHTCGRKYDTLPVVWEHCMPDSVCTPKFNGTSLETEYCIGTDPKWSAWNISNTWSCQIDWLWVVSPYSWLFNTLVY